MSAKYKAAIIGHTGEGNYGHGLDVVYVDMPDVQVVAVADPDPRGLAAASERLGGAKKYADYRDMLATEALDLVNVCPRVVTPHAEMVIAAAESGAMGVFCEKPIAGSLAEADAMLAVCEQHNVKVAVAHRRANPYEQHGKKLVEAGEIGTLQVLRGRGKWDHRDEFWGGSRDALWACVPASARRPPARAFAANLRCVVVRSDNGIHSYGTSSGDSSSGGSGR